VKGASCREYRRGERRRALISQDSRKKATSQVGKEKMAGTELTAGPRKKRGTACLGPKEKPAFIAELKGGVWQFFNRKKGTEPQVGAGVPIRTGGRTGMLYSGTQRGGPHD